MHSYVASMSTLMSNDLYNSVKCSVLVLIIMYSASYYEVKANTVYMFRAGVADVLCQ